MIDTDPVVVITGGGSGIGAGTARALTAAGWRAVITGRRTEPLNAVAEATGAVPIAGDMSDEGHIRRVLDRVRTDYGRLDGLVLNAGIMLPGRLLDLSVEDWRKTLEINLTGPFLLLKASLPLLVDTAGAVVAVGSIGAERTGPGSAAYGTSKAGLVRLIKSVAVDYGPQGVRANVVNPGWVRSEMADAEMDALGTARGIDREAAYRLVTEHVPSRRPATSSEAAAVIAWLLSPQAAYVNGAVVTADGGTSVVGVGTLAFAGTNAGDH